MVEVVEQLVEPSTPLKSFSLWYEFPIGGVEGTVEATEHAHNAEFVLGRGVGTRRVEDY